MAAKSDLGITDLSHVKTKKWPVRILTDGNEVSSTVMAYYGLLAKIAQEQQMELRDMPDGLLRGIDHTISTVARTGHAVFGRADMPDDFAYLVAKALDEHQDLLQWTHLNYSYNIRTVWKAFGVPLHPGAERYYRERGYLK